MNAIKDNSNIPGLDQQNMLNDLPDSERDRELLKGDKAIFELPEVKDIPGQEFIHAMPLGEMADTTIASDDEEGVGILDYDKEEGEDDYMKPPSYGTDEDNSVVIDTRPAADDEEDDDFIDDEDIDDDESDGDQQSADKEYIDASISARELELLDQDGPQMEDSDSYNLQRSKLDDTDWEGEPLNEVDNVGSVDGADLDVPGAELDDEDEALGEEDEENNLYSEADTE